MYTNSQFYNLVKISDYHKLVIDYNNFESFTYIYKNHQVWILIDI